MDQNNPAPETDEDDNSGMELEPRDDTKTALLPLEFFQGKDLQPGSECRIKIERVLEGQAEVSYVPHDSAPDVTASEPEGDEEMAGYMNE